MKSLNWKDGLKRLYFVASAIWYCTIAVEIFKEFDRGYGLSAQTIIVVLLFIAAPFVVYRAATWIYQGFQAKSE